MGCREAGSERPRWSATLRGWLWIWQAIFPIGRKEGADTTAGGPHGPRPRRLLLAAPALPAAPRHGPQRCGQPAVRQSDDEPAAVSRATGRGDARCPHSSIKACSSRTWDLDSSRQRIGVTVARQIFGRLAGHITERPVHRGPRRHGDRGIGRTGSTWRRARRRAPRSNTSDSGTSVIRDRPSQPSAVMPFGAHVLGERPKAEGRVERRREHDPFCEHAGHRSDHCVTISRWRRL